MSVWGGYVELLDKYYTPEQILAIAVIRKGLELDGPRYLLCPCARFWSDILGADPSWLWVYAIKDTEFEGQKFEEINECVHVGDESELENGDN